MNVNAVGSEFCQEYLNGIQEIFETRFDGNNGIKDGKVTIDEAYKDLNVGTLLTGLDKSSTEYTDLKTLIDKVPDALKKYIGSDGVFQPEEWAYFLNGAEWGAVLDKYHSSSNFSKIEMAWIDNSKGMNKDGEVTKGEVKIGVLTNMKKVNANYDTSRIETLIDKYAGDDGTFTVEEYTALKNDPEYMQFVDEFNVVPFILDNTKNSNSDIEFAKTLSKNKNAKETTLKVGRNGKTIKGYSAKNPYTGEMVYADETGKCYTKEAFKNWEKLAKNSNFVYNLTANSVY